MNVYTVAYWGLYSAHKSAVGVLAESEQEAIGKAREHLDRINGRARITGAKLVKTIDPADQILAEFR